MEPIRVGPSLPLVVEQEAPVASSEANEPVESAVSSPAASGSEGKVFQPSAGDEVLISFEHGDPRAPYVTGGLWNAEVPPAAAGNANVPENDRFAEERAKLRSHQLMKLE